MVIANSTTASVEVFVAMIASGFTMRSRCSNSSRLVAMSSTTALDHEVAVLEPVQVIGHRDPPEDGLTLVLGQALASNLLGESRIDTVQHGVRAGLRARAHDHVEACSSRDFGEAPSP